MKPLSSTLLAGAALALAAGPAGAEAPRHARVTQARLDSPEPRNWLMYRGNYQGWGYSALDQIDAGNVRDLAPVWALSTGLLESHQAPPIVNDGVMFVGTPRAQVIALDAASGEVLWRYRRELPADLTQLHPTNRGVALWGDAVFVATVDCFLVALDARTGAVLWEERVDDYRHGYYMTLAPLVARGRVMVGVSGGEFGIRGYVAAYDVDGAPGPAAAPARQAAVPGSDTARAEDEGADDAGRAAAAPAGGPPRRGRARGGRQLWRTHTVPGPGEPGHETWPGDTWKRGGAPVWITGSYDAATGLAYWGTGNPSPWMPDARPGDNLHANSVIALDVETGRLTGHHQYHPGDAWDWDETSAPILVDLPGKGGRGTVPGLVHAGRDAYLWRLERRPDGGIGFLSARPFVRQNVFTAIDPETGRPTYDPRRVPGIGKRAEFCPGLLGGKNWPPAAYSPRTGHLYVPANENLCGHLTGTRQEYVPGQWYAGARPADIGTTIHPGADHIGELQAWDLRTGERAWTHDFADSINWGPVLATAGDLVFAGGTNDRMFRAFDARDGRVLWQFRTNSAVNGVPTSFAIGGRQYVAVQSGAGDDAQRKQAIVRLLTGRPAQEVPQGGVVWVFALREQAAPGRAAAGSRAIALTGPSSRSR